MDMKEIMNMGGQLSELELQRIEEYCDKIDTTYNQSLGVAKILIGFLIRDLRNKNYKEFVVKPAQKLADTLMKKS